MLTFSLQTFGCKINQYDSEEIRSLFLNSGFQEADHKEKADFYIINTCTVTRLADYKSRQFIRRIQKNNPKVKIFVLGCVIKNQQACNILPSEIILIKDKAEFKNYFPLKSSNNSLRQKRTRALLKIQEGCNNFCSFCIVPFTRNKNYSKPKELVLKEIENLISLGYKEIVITGINLGEYGKETSINLSALLEEIINKTKIERIRLSSLEPINFDYKIIDLAANSPKICPHFHIPLQHASSKILRLMKRNYSMNDYNKLINYILKKIPNAALTTDILVGFPYENEEDFKILYDYIKEYPFYRLHTFKYSPRPYTEAVNFKEQVYSKIKEERSALMINLGKEKKIIYQKKFIGQKLNVLAEEELSDYLKGLTANYLEVIFNSNIDLKGEIIKVFLEELKGGYLKGRIC